MTELFPFCGYRYDAGRAGRLSDLATQPYDKIPPVLLDSYLERSPYNVARIIKNPDYRQAGEYFRKWIEQGVLKRDPEPGFYPYQQVFQVDGKEFSRLGFIGLVSLTDSELAIRGHETVLDGPLSDRLQLIRETRSNDGLIFTLFSDPSLSVDRMLLEHSQERLPVGEAVDEFGVINRIWRISDPALLQTIRQAFRGFTLYIADGHHRFETARIFARECWKRGWKPNAVESFDKRMMAFFNMEAPGLHIFPTHRAIRSLQGWDAQQFLRALADDFEIREEPSLDDLKSALNGEKHRLGLVLGVPLQLFSLRLRESSGYRKRFRGAAGDLDVNLLHRGILEPLLGIGPVELTQQKHVDYFRSETEMVRETEIGKYQLGFVLNPTRLSQVREVSELGEKMPQKSTDFFPKLLTGLVFMKMEINQPEATP